MRKFVAKSIVVLSLFLPLFAQAETEEFQCVSYSDEIVSLDVKYSFDGTYQEMMSKSDTPVEATVRVNMRLEAGPPFVYKMQGVGNYSAKGPYFDLKSADGKVSLFISAVASMSPSEFVRNQKTYEVHCD
jgi:hypothetical protein